RPPRRSSGGWSPDRPGAWWSRSAGRGDDPRVHEPHAGCARRVGAGGARPAPGGAAAARHRICRRGRAARHRRARGGTSGEAADDGRNPGLPAARARVLRRAAVAVFTRLLVGLDGSPRADSAFEEAVVLAQRFGSTVVVAYVRERNGHAANGAAMLDRARERLATAGLQAELAEREGEPDVELAELAKASDAVLVGRRGPRRRSAGGRGRGGATLDAARPPRDPRRARHPGRSRGPRDQAHPVRRPVRRGPPEPRARPPKRRRRVARGRDSAPHRHPDGDSALRCLIRRRPSTSSSTPTRAASATAPSRPTPAATPR